ncbi:MAG: dockerin type I domain-containing protein [Gammaproteobacteria bacterium]
MNPTATAQPLGAVSAVQKAPMTPVAAPSSSDPPRAATPVYGAKPNADSVTISDAARLAVSDDPPRAQAPPDRIGALTPDAEMTRAEQIMADLKSSFFTSAGEEGFDTKLDFNKDGVINAGDLGIFREKMAGRTMPDESGASAPTAPPTLNSIRDSFFTQKGEEGFDASADLNGDGVVNAQDLGLYKQALAESAQPVQPVPAELNSTGVDAANPATLNTTESVDTATPGSVIVDEGTLSSPTALSVTIPDVTATASEAGTTQSADPAAARLNLLDQLREALFARGEDRPDSSPGGARNGISNVGDFISIRESV